MECQWAEEESNLLCSSRSDCFTDSLDSQVQSTRVIASDAGGIRTRNREGLSFAAVPVRVPRHVRVVRVVRVGLEPTNTEV